MDASTYKLCWGPQDFPHPGSHSDKKINLPLLRLFIVFLVMIGHIEYSSDTLT